DPRSRPASSRGRGVVNPASSPDPSRAPAPARCPKDARAGCECECGAGCAVCGWVRGCGTLPSFRGGPFMLRRFVLLTVICAATPAFAASDTRVKIAVLDLQARGVDAALASSAGTRVASDPN